MTIGVGGTCFRRDGMSHSSKLFVVLMLELALSQPVMAGGLPVALVQKGCEQMNRGNYSSAIATFTTAVKQNPSDLDARRQLCNAYLGAGMAREAAQQLELIAKVSPGNINDLIALGEAYVQLGDNRAAISKYKQAWVLDSTNGRAVIGLARTLMANGDADSARSVCAGALRSSKDAVLRSQCSEILSTIRTRSYVVKTAANS